MSQDSHYEYAVVYRTIGQVKSKARPVLENWGTNLHGCLKAYNELISNSRLFVNIGVKRRQVTNWEDVDPNELWKE